MNKCKHIGAGEMAHSAKTLITKPRPQSLFYSEPLDSGHPSPQRKAFLFQLLDLEGKKSTDSN